jgi:CspA family cold shock protein
MQVTIVFSEEAKETWGMNMIPVALPVALDASAEMIECDRIWAFDDREIDRQLEAQGLDPARLFHGLDAVLGSHAGAETVAAGASLAAIVPERAAAAGPLRTAANPLPALRPPALAFEAARATAFEVAGTMKFFDPIKRYGFFVADNRLGDVLVHITCLQAAGYATAYEGARVRALVYAAGRGLQALEVLDMDESTAIHPSQLSQRTHAKVNPESEWEAMIVRWYNLKQGYGFINRGEGAPDVFVHAETLRRWGVAPLRPGQVVEVRWGTTDKGRMAAEIRYPGGLSGLRAVH